MKRGWEDVSFAHLEFVPYLSPPEVICLVLTSRESYKTFDTADAWKAVIKASFGPAGEGPRGHRSRRQRRKKASWRSGDGAKARLSLLWQDQTRENVAQLQAGHVSQQLNNEHRWILRQAAAVLGTSGYATRHTGNCSHGKLRLWTSDTMVAYCYQNLAHFQERPPNNPGIRCDRCKVGPIAGPCFRCAAGCHAIPMSPSTVWEKGAGRRGKGAANNSTRGHGYTLCEACFGRRRMFHPPHPFARLRPGFADERLSGPTIYEAVCGDCSFGSSILVRPLRHREGYEDIAGSGSKDGSSALWAVPVRVELSGPLPLSQVLLRIAAAKRADNKGLAFASEKWPIRKAGVSA